VKLLLFCASLLLPVLQASAQDKRVFHPERDLPGFESSDLSEYADLYQLDEFKTQDGKELGTDELAALRQRWTAEKERVAKRIALLESDPRERWVWQLGKRLARSSGFAKLGCKLLRPAPGVVLVLQPPERADPEYEKRVGDFYVPFVERMEANFVELVAKPAGLERRKDQPLTAFAVLATRGEYEKLLSLVRDPGDDAGHTSYDYQLQLALTCEDPDAPDAPPIATRATLLYQVAKELQQAYLGVSGSRPGSIWLYQGLSFLLASHDSSDPASLDRRPPRPEQLEQLVALLQAGGGGELMLLPLDELAGLRSWQDYCTAVEQRAQRMQAQVPGTQALSRAFFAQCDLWAHFLVDGAQGVYRKPFTEFVKLAFRGKGDAGDLRRAFVAFDARTLSQDFLRWACEQQERAHPGLSVDRAGVERMYPAAAAAAPPAKTESGKAAASGPLALVPSGFAPAMLLPDEDDAEAHSALALQQVLEGDLEGGLEQLRALAGKGAEAPWPERIARDSARVEELRKLRDGFLAYLQKSGTVLLLKFKGHDLPAVVESFGDGLVRLRSNELGVPSVPLSQIDPLLLARSATKPEMLGEAQPWARAFASILAGDARWERLLKDDAPGATELRADAKEYLQRMRTAGVVRELVGLSKLPLPREPAEAEACLERVRALLASGAGSGLLVRRMDALRQLALAALGAHSSAGGLGALLHGKWTPLPDDRGKLVYEFDDPAEADDWVKLPGFRLAERESMGKIGIEESASQFAVAKGAWSGSGSVAYRLLVGFSGPVTLRYSFRYVQVKTKYNMPYFAWLICDDEQDSAYRSPPSGEIFVEDQAHYDVRGMQLPDRPVFDWKKDWNVEFSYDGKNLATKLQDKQRAALPAAQLAGGAITLLVHSQLTILFQRVEIEGRIEPAALERLRSRWAAQELKKLGFP
jgi:hypothetical protein